MNMKKLLLPLVVGALGCFVWSCSDDDYYEDFDYGYLPPNAQAFLSSFFYDDDIENCYTEGAGSNLIYVVDYFSGYEVVFDCDGYWIEVDAPGNWSIPSGIAPSSIEWFVVNNFPYAGINEIVYNYWGYEVDLTDGTELNFDSSGNFIGYD